MTNNGLTIKGKPILSSDINSFSNSSNFIKQVMNINVVDGVINLNVKTLQSIDSKGFDEYVTSRSMICTGYGSLVHKTDLTINKYLFGNTTNKGNLRYLIGHYETVYDDLGIEIKSDQYATRERCINNCDMSQAFTPGRPNIVSVVDNTTASFDVSTLSKKGDTAVATIDVKNESNAVGARIGLNLTNSNDTYFKVIEHIADIELQAGDITTVTITIEMLKTPISAAETTTITATLTANPIENSSATGSDSAETEVPSASSISYITRQNEGEITPGDVVRIGSLEDFYVISSDSTKTVLLAKNNLLVGYENSEDTGWEEVYYSPSTTAGYGLQSEDARGYAYNDNNGEWENHGIVYFSATNYWEDWEEWDDEEEITKVTNPYYNSVGEYDGNLYPYPFVYNPTYDTEPDFENDGFYTEGYSVAYYVEEYVNRLKTMGAPSTIIGRLLTNEELDGAQNIEDNGTSIMFNASYWLGSAYGNINVWSVYSNYSSRTATPSAFAQL